MARSEVERSQRTASRSAYAPPTGGETLGLPTIQGVVERVTVRTDRVASRPDPRRLGLRMLVVAGFAGAAWLLGAGAAQAAETPIADPTAVDLVPGVLGGAVDEAVSTVRATAAGSSAVAVAPGTPETEAGTVASQPVLGVAPELLHRVGTAGSQPAPPPGGAATSVVLPGITAQHAVPIDAPATGGGATGPDPGRSASNGAGADGLPGLPGGWTVPTTGVAGRPGDRPSLLTSLVRAVRPVTDPLDRLTGPAVGVVRDVAAPLGALSSRHLAGSGPAWAADPVAGAVTGALAAQRPEAADGPARDGWGPPAGNGAAATMVTAVPVSGDRTVTAITSRVTSVPRGPAPSAAAVTSAAALRTAVPAVPPGTDDVPARPGPGPLRGWAGTGPSTSVSIASSDSGGYAVVPVPVAAGPAADRRPAGSADAGGAGQDAQAPTVSPD